MSNAHIVNNSVRFPILAATVITGSTTSTSSTSYVNTSLSFSFTPKYASSVILLIVQGNSFGNAQYRLARDGGAITAEYAPNNVRGNFVFTDWDTAGSTSSRTYTLQLRNYNGVGTAEFGWAANPMDMTLTAVEFGA